MLQVLVNVGTALVSFCVKGWIYLWITLNLVKDESRGRRKKRIFCWWKIFSPQFFRRLFCSGKRREVVEGKKLLKCHLPSSELFIGARIFRKNRFSSLLHLITVNKKYRGRSLQKEINLKHSEFAFVHTANGPQGKWKSFREIKRG